MRQLSDLLPTVRSRCDGPNARSHGGFSLIEMMIVVAILGIVMQGVYLMVDASTDAQAQQRTSLAAQQDARILINGIAEELRMASSATLIGPGWALGDPQGADGVGDFWWRSIRFRTRTWDVGTQAPVDSNLIEFRQQPGDPTTIERVQYAADDVTIANIRIIGRNVYDEDTGDTGLAVISEDLNGDGMLDPGEDTNGNGVLDTATDNDGDGRVQLGLWFRVDQENDNANNDLDTIEDTNNNGVNDVAITVVVSTRSVGLARTGRAQIISTLQLRNALDPSTA